MSQLSPILFPPIARHGLIGDQCTAALIAADGTLDWFCAPDFDSSTVFAGLLDPDYGGFCRFGPQLATLGRQRYLDDTVTLLTTWPDEQIEVADVMAWPGDESPKKVRGQRVILRRFRATGETSVSFDLRPRRSFADFPHAVQESDNRAMFSFSDGAIGLWTTFPITVDGTGASAGFKACAGDEHWIVLGWNALPEEWSVARAVAVFSEAKNYWEDWSAGLKIEGADARAARLRRSALTVQALRSVQHGSAVAAPTTSLPERLGGDRNYDYRYSWVRDASLSLGLLARMGKTGEVGHYLEWLCCLQSNTKAPLQVCYCLDGNPHLEQEEIAEVRGYADSQPVHHGNRSAKQTQHGSVGFFADCAAIYLDCGGEWREEFWQLLKRTADYTCAHWQEADNGVWELPQEAHFVASRVMSWVVLERAVSIAEKTGRVDETDHWQKSAAAIHAEVMEKGWCEKKNAFRQRYDSDALDAAALLIPLMRFLPIDHPRVAGTLTGIERELMFGGLMHRFNPAETFGGEQLPLGDFEGAFLPCVFWHAHALAQANRCDEAEAILAKCEAIAGEVGLFAEEAHATKNIFLGNTPLLFAHVEYVRAVVELNRARKAQSKAKHYEPTK